MLFLISTLNDSNAHLDACYSNAHLDALLLLQYPQFTQPLNLMRVFCVFLVLGKLGYCEVFSSFVERRLA